MKRFSPLTLIAAASIVLAGCSNSDDPMDLGGSEKDEINLESFNESAQANGDATLTLEQLKAHGQEDICPNLPDNATINDLATLSIELEKDFDMTSETVTALVIHGAATSCEDKVDDTLREHM